MIDDIDFTGAIDWIIGFVALEGLALCGYHRITGRGPAPRDFIGGLVAGLCLMLAVRAVLHHASPIWLGLALSTSFLAHLADLRSRWRR